MPAPQLPAFNQPGIWLAAIDLAVAQIPLTFEDAIVGRSRDKEARAVLFTTAAVSVWNAGVGDCWKRG